MIILKIQKPSFPSIMIYDIKIDIHDIKIMIYGYGFMYYLDQNFLTQNDPNSMKYIKIS